MNSRIRLILKTKNISASKFADEIGVQRSSISHILSGRNNPSLDFIQKTLHRFPDISPDWILTGKGSMYLQADLFSTPVEDKTNNNDLVIEIDDSGVDNSEETHNNLDSNLNQETEQNKGQNQNYVSKSIKRIPETKKTEILDRKKRIEKIIIFYSDKTYSYYLPE